MPNTFTLTDHAQRRCDQRGIGMADIERVTTLGKVISRQGLLFHVMCEKISHDIFRLQFKAG